MITELSIASRSRAAVVIPAPDPTVRRRAVFALALGGFGIGTTEFVSMGLLPETAHPVCVSASQRPDMSSRPTRTLSWSGHPSWPSCRSAWPERRCSPRSPPHARCSPPPHSSCSPARYSCDTEPGVQCGREPTRSARCWSRPPRRSTEPGTSSTTFRSHELRTRWIPTPR
jgi:hypothetical protein